VNKSTIIIAGIDEAGRGAWAGPVVAAAVILPTAFNRTPLKDSKQLTPAKRAVLFTKITATCAYGIGYADEKEIDKKGLIKATNLAMQRAVKALKQKPDQLLVDGRDKLNFELPHQTIIRGDVSVPEISAASIVAKVWRDRYMETLHYLHPEYHFDQHKGYGTALHQSKLIEYGHSPLHRESYLPLVRLTQLRLFEEIKFPKKNSSLKTPLLLHICCAPDATVALERLIDQYEVTCFWYNPNLHPRGEHTKRLNQIRKLCKRLKINLVEGEYQPEEWEQVVRGLETEPEQGGRCNKCIEMRLKKTAQLAKNSNVNLFATVLTTSPRKNAGLINRLGEQMAQALQVKYLASDFKKQNGFARSVELSQKYKLYRQDYCGCRYSLLSRQHRSKKVTESKQSAKYKVQSIKYKVQSTKF